MPHAVIIASYWASLNAVINPLVVDLDKLRMAVEADTAKMQRQLSELWLLLVPVAGHA